MITAAAGDSSGSAGAAGEKSLGTLRNDEPRRKRIKVYTTASSDQCERVSV